MEHINIVGFLVIIVSILCVFLVSYTVLLKKKNKELAEQLRMMSMALETTRTTLSEFKEKQNPDNNFRNSLETAELTTKLQRPRLEVENKDGESISAGRYSTIQALRDQGLSIEEIATTLAISVHEANQLVNLSKLAQPNSTDQKNS